MESGCYQQPPSVKIPSLSLNPYPPIVYEFLKLRQRASIIYNPKCLLVRQMSFCLIQLCRACLNTLLNQQGVYSQIFRRSKQILLNKFLDLITPSMRKIDNGEKREKKKESSGRHLFAGCPPNSNTAAHTKIMRKIFVNEYPCQCSILIHIGRFHSESLILFKTATQLDRIYYQL